MVSNQKELEMTLIVMVGSILFAVGGIVAMLCAAWMGVRAEDGLSLSPALLSTFCSFGVASVGLGMLLASLIGEL